MISSLLYFVYNVFHDDEGHKPKCVALTIKVVLFITCCWSFDIFRHKTAIKSGGKNK